MSILGASHGIGPDNESGVPQYAYPLPSFSADIDFGAGVVSSYGSFTLSRVDPLSSIDAGSMVVTSAITGSGSSQTVNVSYTGDMAADPPAYWLCDPGTAQQEVVRATAIPSATTMTCKLFNNHAAGAVILKIHSVWTKYLLPKITPTTTLTDPVLIRMGALPSGVFDHFVMAGSFGTFAYVVDDAFPWVNGSTATPSITAVPLVVPQYGPVGSDGKPSNGALVYSGTISGAGGLYTQPRVQLLFTTPMEPPIAPEYRIWASVP